MAVWEIHGDIYGASPVPDCSGCHQNCSTALCQQSMGLLSKSPAAAAAASLQSCLTLCDPTDGRPRLPCPWDSPGKNTGIGCHFLLQCMQVKRESEVAQSCLTHSDPMDCSLPGFPAYGIFQAKVLEWGAIAFSAKSPTACQLNTSCNHFY